MTVTPLQGIDPSKKSLNPFYKERCDLAAAFRWAVRYDWHEAAANHFSLAVSDDGAQFLMNPDSRHFSRIKASDLLLIDAKDPETMNRPDAPDPTAWGLHGSVHRNVPHARCVLHCHPTYASVVTSLKDSSIPPIDQNTMRFYKRVAIDEGFGGMAFAEEGERVCQLLGNHSVLMMGNHGVMVVAPTVAEAFDELYYLERACRTLVLAYSTGRELKVVADDVASKTCQQWQNFPAFAEKHFAELLAILDRDEPDFRD